MTTDRDLLILAAKAAGLDYTEANYAEPGLFPEGWGMVAGIGKFWNPLIDDGDALRLAAQLKLDVYNYPLENEPHVSVHDIRNEFGGSVENYDGNALTAIRRAIVRAAADLGRSMP